MLGSVRAGVLSAMGLLLAGSAFAGASCTGTIDKLYSSVSLDAISVQLLYADGTRSTYVRLPSKSFESMALIAYATGKTVILSWDDETVVSCSNTGWANNRLFDGIFLVKN